MFVRTEGHARRVAKNFPQRLGGNWNPNGDGAVGNYFSLRPHSNGMGRRAGASAPQPLDTTGSRGLGGPQEEIDRATSILAHVTSDDLGDRRVMVRFDPAGAP
jgi:hypothetical protein